MSKKKKILLSLPAILLLSTFSNFAMASNECNSVVASEVLAAKQAQYQNTLGQTPPKKLPTNSSSELLGCSNVWPTANFGFTLPKISDVLKKVGEEAMNKACDTAREKINEQLSKVQQNMSLNASNISGFNELGISDIGLGSANISAGTGSSAGITQNGGGWSGITSSFK